MERLKGPKQGNKAKKKQQQPPMKVVYITNPMRFKTSASEFRALVQELTGKDSDVADNLAKYSAQDNTGSSSTSDRHHRRVSITSNSDSGRASDLDGAGANGGPVGLFDAAFQNFPLFFSSFNDLD